MFKSTLRESFIYDKFKWNLSKGLKSKLDKIESVFSKVIDFNKMNFEVEEDRRRMSYKLTGTLTLSEDQAEDLFDHLQSKGRNFLPNKPSEYFSNIDKIPEDIEFKTPQDISMYYEIKSHKLVIEVYSNL